MSVNPANSLSTSTALVPVFKRFYVEDIETWSDVDLKKASRRRYFKASAKIILIGGALDDRPAWCWHPGEPIPADVIEAYSDPECAYVSHGTFDPYGIEQIAHQQLGWPLFPPHRRINTIDDLHMLGYPGELALAARILALQHQKLPRPKNNAPLDEWDRYNLGDVETTRELVRRIHHLVLVTPTERRFREMHAAINETGFAVDLDLAWCALRIVKAEIKAINTELATITGKKIKTIDQNVALLAWLRERGANIKNLTKDALAAFDSSGLPDDVRRVIELRQSGAKATVKKLKAFLDFADDDDRIREAFSYHQAHTGRSAGRGSQVQNIKKVEIRDDELATAIALARSGDYAQFKQRFAGDTLGMIANLMRSIVWAGK
jgi:hypothetical protein